MIDDDSDHFRMDIIELLGGGILSNENDETEMNGWEVSRNDAWAGSAGVLPGFDDRRVAIDV